MPGTLTDVDGSTVEAAGNGGEVAAKSAGTGDDGGCASKDNSAEQVAVDLAAQRE